MRSRHLCLRIQEQPQYLATGECHESQAVAIGSDHAQALSIDVEDYAGHRLEQKYPADHEDVGGGDDPASQIR